MTNAFPHSARTMTFIVTRDRGKSKAFFRDVLGFKMTYEDQFAAVFDLNGTSLRVSSVPDFLPQAHTVLGWQVPDIVASVKALASKGVRFTVYDGMGQDELAIWTAPGSKAKVAWFLDPDGNNLSLSQL
jgi:catechol 2,3-dioxygenase-like lactoylglutathione lyase family enzyme